jgi:hypothetical protein
MKVRVWASTGKVGSRVESEIEIEDDMTDDEIDEIAREELFSRLISWSWERKDH